MSASINLTPGMAIILFANSLNVVISAVGVRVGPWYMMRFPPTVARTRFGFFFCCQTSATICKYVALLPLGSLLGCIQMTHCVADVPIFRLSLDRRPNSLEPKVIHVFLLSPCMRCLYSSHFGNFVLYTALHCASGSWRNTFVVKVCTEDA